MALEGAYDSIPLTFQQARALLEAVGRQLTWGLRVASREVAMWRALAETIPDGPIRDDALYALRHKRGHADGAALFAILPERREPELVRLLVGYETILDFLDNVSERHPVAENGLELHRAMSDALDVDATVADYYRHHPWRDDGGYLLELVETCRRCCRALPSYEQVRPLAVTEARRAQVLALNHIQPDAARDAALIGWARQEHPNVRHVPWYELSGTASASILVLALLALATRSDVTERDARTTYESYWPWMGLIGVMLDSFADQAEDAASGDHSYVAHYGGRDEIVRGLRRIVEEAARNVAVLPRSHHHLVILASMVSLYLSKDSARDPRLRSATCAIARAGGSLTRILLPVLRIWRTAHRLQGA